MTEILKNRVEVVGIIPGSYSEMLVFANENEANFKLFAPQNIDEFKKKMRLKLRSAQTLLYHNNKILLIEIGALSGDDFTTIIKTAKNL